MILDDGITALKVYHNNMATTLEVGNFISTFQHDII
jgi:hypothetical protein